MSTPSERFRMRKKRQRQANESPNLCLIPQEQMVREFLLSEVDYESIDAIAADIDNHYRFDFDVDVTDAEVIAQIDTLRGRYSQKHAYEMAQACKSSVIVSIIKPFGLARFVAKQDKDGGNVTTKHNARKGIYAKHEHEYSRNSYEDARAKQSMSDYKKARVNVESKVIDEYTGRPIDDFMAETDHIVPLKEYHNNGGFMQSGKKRRAFAQDKNNYALIERSINRSKKDQPLKSFEQRVIAGEEDPNSDRYGTDGRRTTPAEKRGRQAAAQHLPTSKEEARYYLKESVTTGAQESAKMGIQQAIGVLLVELVEGLWDELYDIYRSGIFSKGAKQTFFGELKIRLERVSKRVLRRWKDVIRAFGGGALSGFISNMVTAIINMTLTTVKRAVRIIREGFFSLLNAIRMVCIPPPGLTLTQAAHEATKLIAAGLVVSGGIALEEIVEKALLAVPLLVPFASIISSVVVGVATGIATSILVYAIDKIDAFGVNFEQESQYIQAVLDDEIASILRQGDMLSAEYL